MFFKDTVCGILFLTDSHTFSGPRKKSLVVIINNVTGVLIWVVCFVKDR